LAEIVRYSPLPIVADIHFDYKLALAALDGKVLKGPNFFKPNIRKALGI